MRTMVAVLLFTPFAVAAPVPKKTEAQQIEKQFGKIVDPKGDSKFTLDGDKLTITLPANQSRIFDYTGDPLDRKKGAQTFDAPRVELAASGDFTLTVRVTTTLDAKANRATEEEMDPLACGGAVFFVNTGAARMGVAHAVVKGEQKRLFEWKSPHDRFKGLASRFVIPGEVPDAVWLRVTRTGKDTHTDTSFDGVKWSGALDFGGYFTEEAFTLGLYAQHSSDTAHAVTFDQFKVEPAKK